MILFYCTCIRSILEYASPVFHHSLPRYLSDDIERIQRSALRIIYPGLSYHEALDMSRLHNLDARREIYCVKIVLMIFIICIIIFQLSNIL